MDEDNARIKFIWLVVMIVLVVVAAVFLSRQARGDTVKPVFGARLEICYDESRVGIVVSTSGKVIGAGKDKGGARFFDLVDPSNPPGKAVRAYTLQDYRPRKGKVYVMNGLITAPGRLILTEKPKLVPPLAQVVPASIKK